ncbi:jg633, partial [Pararge aegeria aegeria]
MRGRLNDWWCKDRLKEKGEEGGHLLSYLEGYGEIVDPDQLLWNAFDMLPTAKSGKDSRG